jgi:Lon-like protease
MISQPPPLDQRQLDELRQLVRKADQRRLRRNLAIWGSLLAVWVAVLFIRFDSYLILKPGSADEVDRRLAITGTKIYAPKGDTLWATVGIVEGPTLPQLVAGWLSSNDDVPKRKDVYGDETPKEAETSSRLQMEDAKQVSEIVAARKLGFKTSGGGAEVVEIGETYPAAKVLKVGDIITRVNGSAVCLQADVGASMKGAKPGDTVNVTVRRNGKPLELKVPTVKVKDVARPIIGIALSAALKTPCKAPFSVEITTGRIGGPSAGLAMTIAMLERLSPGELVAGQKVAVTGTIEGDGSVGPVGGVKQKTLAVRAAGAKLFLVPTDEVDLATPYAGSMSVVGVANLDDALAALRKFGGDPLPSP